MSNTRVAVIMRKDLQLPTGLACAQATHTAMEFLRQRMIKSEPKKLTYKFSKLEKDWVMTPYISILAVECYEDLKLLWEETVRSGLPCEKWVDTIPSPTFEGKAIEANVGFMIGPADFDEIKLITNPLELF